jgi:superfamily II DNA or RNA helicase
MERNERFEKTISLWKDNFYRGIVLFATGIGKTRGLSIKTLQLPEVKSAIVIVPTIKLKKDWELITKEIDIPVKVIVINTAIKHTYKCDLLIVDEIHSSLAEEFIKIYDCIKFDKFLGLTATIYRQDGREKLILSEFHIIDRITLKEGIEYGWLTPYNINVEELDLNKTERTKLDQLDERFKKLTYELTIDNKSAFENADKFIKYLNIKKFLISKESGKMYHLSAIKTIAEKTWKRTITNEEFKELLQRFRVLTPEENNYYRNLSLAAKNYYKVIRDRKSLLTNNSAKIKKTVELLKELSDVIVFSEEIKFIKKIAEHLDKLGLKYSIYHSKQTPKERDRQLLLYENGETDILLSAKALNTGVSINRISNAIVSSYSSSKLLAIQTVGRTLRLDESKLMANVYYLVIKNSQEEKWLQNIKKVI